MVSDGDQAADGMEEINPLYEEVGKLTNTELSDALPATNHYDVVLEKPESAVKTVYFDFSESK